MSTKTKHKAEWGFAVISDEYGAEEYGGYDRRNEALRAQDRIRAKAARLDDGIERVYSAPYQVDEAPDIHLNEGEAGGVASCGCALDYDEAGSARLRFCPLHRNAEALLQQLKRTAEQVLGEWPKDQADERLTDVYAVIKAVEGKWQTS